MGKYKKTAEYLESQAPQLGLGSTKRWTRYVWRAFPALKSRNYQLYISGQFVSLIGSWMQTVAEGWLVFQMTNSAVLIGLVTALSTLPVLFLSLFGGVIIDNFPKKYILFLTQGMSMILAFALAVLTLLGIINIYEIMMLSFLLGVVKAIDSPTRQAFISELVDKEHFASAIAINSGIFNAARIIGPSVAGILIAWMGTGGAFFVNAISYIAVIVALIFVKTPTVVVRRNIRPIEAIREGIVYVWKHKLIRDVFLYLGVVSIFAWSFTTEMPYIAEHAFNAGASGLGYLYAAIGLGAICASFFISIVSGGINKFSLILLANMLFVISILGFSVSGNFILGLSFLFVSGFSLLMTSASLNTIVQSRLKDSFRGRAMSIYVLIFVGFMPLGNMETGFLTEHFGWAEALQINSIIVLLAGLYMFFNKRTIRLLGEKYR